MGANVNPIVIQVSDAVAPTIAPNLKNIASSARDAETALNSLRASLGAVSNVGALSQSIRQTSSATAQLNRTTTRISSTAASAATNITKLSSSYQSLAFNVGLTIRTLAGYSLAVASANTASRGFQQTAVAAGSGAQGFGAGTQTAALTIKTLEGNTLGATRAAGAFLTQTLGLGKVLQFAFPVIGAIALVEVFAQLYHGVEAVSQAFTDMSQAAVKAQFDAAEAGDKFLKVEAEAGFFSAEGLARNLAFDRSTPIEANVKQSSEVIKQFAQERRELLAANRADEAKFTGVALDNERVRNLKKENELLAEQKKKIDELAQSLRSQGEASHYAPGIVGGNFGEGELTAPRLIPDFTEPQRKAFAESVKTAKDESRNLASEMRIVGSEIDEVNNKKPFAALKDEAKAARLQLKEFEGELAKLKTDKGGVVQPSDKLALLQSQLDRALPQNQLKISSEIATTTQAAERQKTTIQELADKWSTEAHAIDNISLVQRTQNEVQKVTNQLKRDGIDVNSAEAQSILGDVRNTIADTEVHKELNSVYESANGPLIKYIAAQQVIIGLEQKGLITHNQALIATNEATKSYKDATQPLFEFSKGLEREVELLGKYGTALRVATEVQRIQVELQAKGRDLNTQELSQLTQTLTQLEKQRTIQSDINSLYEQNIGAIERLTLSYAAFLKAQRAGILSREQEQLGLAKIKVELAEIQLQMGKATGKDVLTATFGNYIKEFQGFTKETTKLYQNMFARIADGAADSLGRALAYGEDLGAALKDVARQALSQLIAGFIKLGIQWLITAAIGRAIGTSALAATTAEATAAATAWAPAAAFASLATLGANAAPADAALASTVGLAEALSFLHFAKGGIVPGYGDRDTVPTMLMPGEGVLNKRAVAAIGTETIKALNSGARYVQNDAAPAAQGRTPMRIEIVPDSRTVVRVQQPSDGTIRIIAKEAVEEHASRVIATDLQDPNSRTSKAVQRNHVAPRRR